MSGPSGVSGGKPVAPAAPAAAEQVKAGAGDKIKVHGGAGDAEITVHQVKGGTGSGKAVEVSQLGAKLLETVRSSQYGTKAYFVKHGFQKVETMRGNIYVSAADYQKAEKAGVNWNFVDVPASIQTAKAEEATRQQHESAAAAKLAARALKHKGLHGSQRAGHHSGARFAPSAPKTGQQSPTDVRNSIDPNVLPKRIKRD